MASDDEEICGVCTGKKSEHFDAEGKPIRQHVFSAEGRLMTHAQQAKQNQGQAAGPTFLLPQKFAGTDAQALSRLIEILLDRKLIDTADALYIFGVGPKQDAPSGFVDPAVMV